MLTQNLKMTKEIAGIKCDILENKEFMDFMKNEVPTGIEYIISEDDEVAKAVAIWIQHNKTVLIKWPKGTGKTSVAAYVAQELNRPLLYMQLTWTTSVDEFVWCYLIKDQSTYWMDGILAKAMRYGYVLVLDEANMPTWEITAILHSVMDDRKILVQGNRDSSEDNVIKAHENFRIIATINPSDEWSYVGTKEMNESLIDRFKIVVNSNYPTYDLEVKILESKKSILFNDKDTTCDKKWKVIKSSKGVLTRMCLLAKEVRGIDIDYTLSTRNLIDWAELSCFLPIIEAYNMTFKNKMDKDSEKEVQGLILKYFSENERVSKEK